MPAEIEVEEPKTGFKGKLNLNFKVQASSLKICVWRLEPVWTWKGVKNEKFLIHIDKDGNFSQRKVGLQLPSNGS